ncbi:carbohydrate ABC transporter permease [Rhizobium leguminosarum]|uniref:carbohydrate ABC transporter permease n=1 Tax=Rhizobium leguminosarum TaxID=384 RepID=UPI001C90A5A2|nr:carbohydrate ABC transporter permease [Rhizobium leguminosarum]MBY3002048.1 carbohydrate ABC transporter permease [Rhizobium leguminosarum]
MKTKFLYAIALVAGVLTILPPLWALFVSLSVNNDAGAGFGLENYRDVLSQAQFWGSLWNSFLTASLSTAISIVLGCMAAFGMTRLGGEFNRIALVILALRMVPSIVLVIPFYLLFRQAGYLDTVAGLTTTYLTFSLPFAIWMIRGFFTAIPATIDEAARLDGANSWTILWKIIVPISAGPILTTAVLIFCFCWNEFLFALVLTDSKALTFLPLLMRYVPPQGPLYGQIFAGSTIYFLVPIVALAMIRKQLGRGFVSGSVK